MGGKKKTTVGYRYFFGLHMGIGRGPVDELVAVKVGDKLAWGGSVTGNQTVAIKRPDLFGGDDREGGIDGSLTVLQGAPDQAAHEGLTAMLGGVAPAFRGVMTLFFDGLVCSGSPYPKPWKMRVRRAKAGWAGACWYPERAQIALTGSEISAADGAVQDIRAMNPVHMLYECITNPDWGRGIDGARLDEAAWRKAADTAYAEGFGMCLKWSRSDKLSQFMQEVIDTLGAVQYVDRSTGLIVLKLIRDDYQADQLPLFDADSGLLAITEDENSALATATNEVIATYHSPVDNSDHQVRVRSLGAIHAAGGLKASSSVEYPGIPTAALALRVAQRDLTAGSGHIKKFKLQLDRRGHVLAPGSVFRLRDLDRGIAEMVLRVGRIEYGEMTEGVITVTALQDLFGLPSTSFVGIQDTPAGRPDTTPAPITQSRLIELPYREIAQAMDAANLALLTDTSAYLGALAARPTSMSMGFRLLARAGSSVAFADRGEGPFSPSGQLATAMALDTLTISLTQTTGLERVVIGTAALIDDEVVRVDAVDPAAATVTLGRGCSDTVPAAHGAGARVWFYDDFSAADPTEYSTGVALQAKLLAFTSAGALAESAAAVGSLTLIGRAAKPYPPGRARFNGMVTPPAVSGVLSVSWAHRNRLVQADQLVDTAAGSIDPEPGTRYGLRCLNASGGLIVEKLDLTGTSAQVTLIAAGTVSVELYSITDRGASLQRHRVAFAYTPPAGATENTITAT